MGDLKKYREIAKEVLTRYTEGSYINGDIEDVVVFDEVKDRYLVMSMGWRQHPPGRVHDCIVQVDIIDGKLWVQGDNTDVGLAGELEEAGVPRSDIVLGFRTPEQRRLTDYTAA
jgi:hypothetical protein